jgi:hypothetical protein
MSPERIAEILQRQSAIAEMLKSRERRSAEFKKWQRDTEVALEQIFGSSSRNVSDFKELSYSLSAFSSRTPDSAFQEAYVRGLSNAQAVLASILDNLREFPLESDDSNVAPDVLNLVERICLRFHAAARTLRARHDNRPTLEIEDEYDVQDLLHGFLRLHFDDIRPEEWTPSYAGRASRLDFLLRAERIVVEVKKMRSSLPVGKLGEELIIDRARYERHPDCDTLVCFIYDPEGRIGNPHGLERDLEDHDGRLKVRVIVSPKS